tara:strand:- start:1072 stop:1335 length:264 start_codon:yes stop_codon:yes gene_type:complete
MPTYDYICNDCEKMYEYFQSMSDAPIKECPECKKNTLRRVISGGTGLIFKGSGYYLTDYKNKKTQSSENKKSKKKKKNNKVKKKVES